jgi:hypothetical protein
MVNHLRKEEPTAARLIFYLIHNSSAFTRKISGQPAAFLLPHRAYFRLFVQSLLQTFKKKPTFAGSYLYNTLYNG